MAEELNRFLRGEPVKARPIRAPGRAFRWCRRNRELVTLGSALVFMLLLLSIVGPIVAVRQIQKSHELAAQLRLSTALRLAAQARAVAKDWPVLSVLLAVEAVESTRRHDGTTIPVAHETLLTTTANLGGWPLVMVPERIESVVVSPDDRWLVAGGASGARLWEMSGQKTVTSRFEFLRHLRSVQSVAIGPKGRLLATGSEGGLVQLWELNSTTKNPAASAHQLPGHRRAVDSIAFSPNGRWLASGSRDRTARVWDLTADEPAATSIQLSEHTNHVKAVAFSPDGHWLVTGGDRTVRFWDLRSLHDEDEPVSSRVLRAETGVWAIDLSPNGRWLVAGTGTGMVYRYDLSSEDPVASAIELRGHDKIVDAVAISPDGRWLITGSMDRTVRRWDLASEDVQSSSRVLRGSFR